MYVTFIAIIIIRGEAFNALILYKFRFWHHLFDSLWCARCCFPQSTCILTHLISNVNNWKDAKAHNLILLIDSIKAGYLNLLLVIDLKYGS